MKDHEEEYSCYQCLLPKHRISLPRIAAVAISRVGGISLE